MKGQTSPYRGPQKAIETQLSDEEMARVRAAAERAGLSVEDYVSMAASAELRRRYVLPSSRGVVVTLPRGKDK